MINNLTIISIFSSVYLSEAWASDKQKDNYKSLNCYKLISLGYIYLPWCTKSAELKWVFNLAGLIIISSVWLS